MSPARNDTNRPIAINGRFLTRPTTGVERTAFELVRAIAQIMPAGRKLLILSPKDAKNADIAGVEQRAVGRLSGQLWEQWDLPKAASGMTLLNLCNMSPVLHDDSLLVIHDTQVKLMPDAFRPAFRHWYGLIQPAMARRARRLVTVSRYSRDNIVRFGIAPRDKTIHVVGNGSDHIDNIPADNTVLSRNQLPVGKYLLAIGSLSIQKNLRLVFEAMEHPHLVSTTLVVVGNPSGAAFAAKGVTVGPNVRFVGRVNDPELKALYTGAAGLLFPSFEEGFGIPPLEAMRCGCPVIAAPCGAIPEVCGNACLYADPHDPVAWSNAIAELADSPARRTQMIESGYMQASQFTWERSAKHLLSVL